MHNAFATHNDGQVARIVGTDCRSAMDLLAGRTLIVRFTEIRWRHDVDYYRRVATWYGGGQPEFERLQSWYRFFMMPSVGHCTGGLGGGNGPPVVDPFLALVNWIENGRCTGHLAGARSRCGSRPRPYAPAVHVPDYGYL